MATPRSLSCNSGAVELGATRATLAGVGAGEVAFRFEAGVIAMFSVFELGLTLVSSAPDDLTDAGSEVAADARGVVEVDMLLVAGESRVGRGARRMSGLEVESRSEGKEPIALGRIESGRKLWYERGNSRI